MSPASRDALAASALLIVGHGVGALSLAAWGPPAGETGLPPWVFVAVWCVLFPTMAIGARRAQGHTALGAVLVAVAWMPLACAAQHPGVTVALDVSAWVAVWLAVWAQPAPARAWLLPAAVWMPITTALSGLAAARGLLV